MKKLFTGIQEKFLLLVKGTLLGTTISLAPLALIYHRQGWLFFNNLDWSLKGFFVLCLVSGMIFCLCTPLLPFNNFMLILILLYLFFYTACCALCQKLGWTLILADSNNQISGSSFITPLPIMILGWFLICLAAARQITIAIQHAPNAQKAEKDKGSTTLTPTDKTPSKQPLHLSWLFFLAGIPLSFGVWFPLIALPGAWVAMKWLD